MEADFWQQCWERREIGFHQAQVHPLLCQHWPSLSVAPGRQVLVPLCGKSKDMAWLAQQGYQVTGVELSEMAVQEFFAEQAMTPQVTRVGEFLTYRAANITLWVGDFFALAAKLLTTVDAVYDRASLVALPPGMRDEYAALLTRLLPAQVESLLITFEYPSGAVDAPPFSIDEDEVSRLYSARCDIDLLASHAVDLRGVDSTEHLFRLRYR